MQPAEGAPRACPVCGALNPHLSITRDAIPIFQNVVHRTREAALAAVRAPFRLGTCRACGFSYNALFNAGLMTYDPSYDNHVASSAFEDYYRSLAQMMIARFGLDSGTVYDVGCGKGEFLRILCSLAPGIRGVGMDPSCTPVDEGNFRLIRAPFEASLFEADARLVICRHVLEHIDGPRAFMAELAAAVPDVPVFVEVPNFDWILENDAFWDFCYEHCNYFTPATLAGTLARAGLRVDEQALSFGGQYQWAIARPLAGRAEPADDREAASTAATLQAVRDYAEREGTRLAALAARAASAGGITVWGMATKGVLLTTLMDPTLFLGGIDSNRRKQGCFAPGSGVEIHPPSWIESLAPGATILVMNPNYLAEIKQQVRLVRPDLVLEPV